MPFLRPSLLIFADEKDKNLLNNNLKTIKAQKEADFKDNTIIDRIKEATVNSAYFANYKIE